jgi:hypothetical protein
VMVSRNMQARLGKPNEVRDGRWNRLAMV